MMKDQAAQTGELKKGIKLLTEDIRKKTAVSIKRILTLLYRHIGERIETRILKQKRGEYGKPIIAAVTRKLRCTHINKLNSAEELRKRNFFAVELTSTKGC